jgi:3D (Asp-Asp-Asp) domain-containing protein
MWGGYPVRRGSVKGSNGLINRITVLFVSCVLSFVAGAAYTKADKPITPLNATITETKAETKPVLEEPRIKAEPTKPATNSAALMPLPSKSEDEEKAETKSEPSDEWRIVRMKVTGYCPCARCCGQYSDGITANGHKIQPGDTFVAADKRYSFGTEMVIEGYNDGRPVKVLDRGGAIQGNKLDAFFHTHQQALEWGVRYIDVKVRDK